MAQANWLDVWSAAQSVRAPDVAGPRPGHVHGTRLPRRQREARDGQRRRAGTHELASMTAGEEGVGPEARLVMGGGVCGGSVWGQQVVLYSCAVTANLTRDIEEEG